MFLDFMKPDVWDGVVVGVTLIGVALAILRLMGDRAFYQRQQQKSDHASPPDQSPNE